MVKKGRLLNGKELAGFIKERQSKQVRNLWQEYGVKPKLVILRDSNNPVIDLYVGLKKRYGAEILVDVEDRVVKTRELAGAVEEANEDESVHGVIVQLPILEPEIMEDIVGGIVPEKDVDGLSEKGDFDSATATAIDWLLNGYGVELEGKKIAIVGRGKLVGRPLIKMWTTAGFDVTVFGSKDAGDLSEKLKSFDVVVTATGVPGLIKPEMLKTGAVVVDAGTASEDGVVKGDVDENVRSRDDLTITPKVGGVGPLTVTVLFDDVIRAALKRVV